MLMVDAIILTFYYLHAYDWIYLGYHASTTKKKLKRNEIINEIII